MIRKRITEVLKAAADRCKAEGLVPRDLEVDPFLEIPREEEHGDYSTNLAFSLAKRLRKSPVEVAKLFIDHLGDAELFEKVEIAGKGFINFHVRDEVVRSSLRELYQDGADAFMPDVGQGRRVLLEFVSANPTGPLHIGHGRGAAVGDVMANVLGRTGFSVTREYYVNDAGRQIETLGRSVYLRWRELKGERVDFAEGLYQGEYVKEIAARLVAEGARIPEDEDEAVRFMAEYAARVVLDGIKADLDDFRVHFDSYFLESGLYDEGLVEDTIEKLRRNGYLYEEDGALWFRASGLGDEKDRVIVKSGGEKTYLASDMAYHRQKLERGFDLLVDIWGSDHHGYIPRLKASMEALGQDRERLKVMLIQFVTLLKDGKPVGMSTRSGQFTTLREVMDEVGTDAARFFFLMRKSDAHLEFDLDLAKKTSNDNPVFYVQYAHARIHSIFRVAAEEGIDVEELGKGDVALLTQKEEVSLIKSILGYYQVVEGSARSLEPHRLTFYLVELVGRFHSYYNKVRVLTQERDLTLARLLLLKVLRDVIGSGLAILGVSAPERM